MIGKDPRKHVGDSSHFSQGRQRQPLVRADSRGFVLTSVVVAELAKSTSPTFGRSSNSDKSAGSPVALPEHTRTACPPENAGSTRRVRLSSLESQDLVISPMPIIRFE
jgi:hypothetical protein